MSSKIYPASLNDNILYDEKNLQTVKKFTLDFYQHSFSEIILTCQHEIERDTTKVEENDKIHLFTIITFFLKFSICYNKQQMKINPQAIFDIQQIGDALSLEFFSFLYSLIVAEISKERKRDFNVRYYHAFISTLLQTIYIIKEMAYSSDEKNRKNSKKLQHNLFAKEIVKIIKIGFTYYLPLAHGDAFTQNLVELTMVFFDLMEDFSKGRVFKIQTDRRIRRKIKAKKVKKKKKVMKKRKIIKQVIKKQEEPEQPKEEIANKENNNQESSESDDFLDVIDPQNKKEKKKEPMKLEENSQSEYEFYYSEDSSSEDEVNEVQQQLYEEYMQTRDAKVEAEFAGLADYTVLTKLFSLLQNGRIHRNPEVVNLSIAKFFERVLGYINGVWIFYQMDYIQTFSELLDDDSVKYSPKYERLVKVINQILRHYFDQLEKNPLMLIESFFRLTGLKERDSILTNYENLEDYDPTLDEKIVIGMNDMQGQVIEIYKPWSSQEDSNLINYYEELRGTEDIEYSLFDILRNQGSNQSVQDIIKRIKILKLIKGKEKALQEYERIHENDKQKKSIEEMAEHMYRYLQFKKENNKQEFSIQEMIQYLKNIVSEFDQFKKQFDNCIEDLPIVPKEKLEFDMFDDRRFLELLEVLNFRKPSQGEWMWRIPYFINFAKISMDLDKFSECIAKEEINDQQKRQQIEQPLLSSGLKEEEIFEDDLKKEENSQDLNQAMEDIEMLKAEHHVQDIKSEIINNQNIENEQLDETI